MLMPYCMIAWSKGVCAKLSCNWLPWIFYCQYMLICVIDRRKSFVECNWLFHIILFHSSYAIC